MVGTFSQALNNPSGRFANRTSIAPWLREAWEDEVYRELERNFYMWNTVSEVPADKLAGGLYKQPRVGRLAVNPVTPGNPVSLQAYREDTWTMEVRRYSESSFAIHDIATLFDDVGLRSEYSYAVGYALAQDMDNWLLGYRIVQQQLGRFVSATTVLDRATILAAKLRMDLDLVPPTERIWVFSPSQHTSLLSVPEFTSGDFVSGQPTMTGEVGQLYGSPVIVNNNILRNSVTGASIITGVDGSGNRTTTNVATPGMAVAGTPNVVSPWYPVASLNGDPNGAGQESVTIGGSQLPANRYTGMLVRKGWLKAGYKQTPKTEAGREISMLSDIVVTSTMYDAKVYRPEFCVLLHSAESV